MLDLYYASEGPLPNDIPSLTRRLRLGSDDVQNVLKEFFDLRDDGYHNCRCDEEISKFLAWVETQRANGRKGGRRPKQPQKNPSLTHGKPIANPSLTHGQATHNPEPITQDPEPKEEKKKKKRKSLADEHDDAVNSCEWPLMIPVRVQCKLLEFFENRKQSKKYCTSQSIKQNIENVLDWLTKYSEQDVMDTIGNAIGGNWQGLPEPKPRPSFSGAKPAKRELTQAEKDHETFLYNAWLAHEAKRLGMTVEVMGQGNNDANARRHYPPGWDGVTEVPL